MSRTDEELIVLSQHGDETAFAELMDRYQNKVYTLAVHLLADREEGRDVAQEVFIRVYHALPRFRKDADFLRWLYTITANIARDRWRRRKREKGTIRVSLDEINAELADHRFSPEPLLVKKDVRLMVEKAIASLPWDYRIPIVLRHSHELSYEEIAEIMKIPLNTVKTRIRRGRLLLKDILAPMLEQRRDS